MSSKPRNFTPRSYYHIYNHAVHEKTVIFPTTQDYQRFLNTIAYYIFSQPFSYEQHQRLSTPPANPKGLRKRAKILAYAIMPNHFHLLLKPTEENPSEISRFVSDVTNSYTRHFNLKYKRSGVLFQGTFKAKEIIDEASLLQVSRYIHLNPLFSSRTNPKGLLVKPQNYEYTSYHEWAGFKNPHIVEADEIRFWTGRTGGTAGYRSFTEAKIKSNPASGIEQLILEK